MSPPVVEFESFFNLAKFFYLSIGMEPYEQAYWKTHSNLLRCFFWINILNLQFVVITEVIFAFSAMYNGNHFLEATMSLSYIGFAFVADIKIWSICQQKSKITELMRNLRAVFPNERKRQLKKTALKVVFKRTASLKQQDYDVYRFLWRYNFIGFGFAFIHLLLIWTYNLFAMMNFILYNTPRMLPYYCWLPWDWHDHWSYRFLYASQNFAGHTGMNAQIANDLLLCVVVTQIIMHYRYLAKRITEHVVAVHDKKSLKKGELIGGKTRDLEFLATAIDYHQRIISLTDTMNDIFGISLLMNFAASVFILCFLGFLITIGADTTILVMLFLFILCSLVQVYMISSYGQDLTSISESIGHAVYNHDWYNADLRYKKMLGLIIERSQKPAVLKATKFLNISLGTMTDLLRLSYKFFALLHTMYSQ